MRIRIVTAALAGLLIVSALVTCFFCVWYVWSARQSLIVQGEIIRLNATGMAVRSLLAESIEYSRRNPSIVPLLQSWSSVLPRGVLNTNQPGAATTSPTPRTPAR